MSNSSSIPEEAMQEQISRDESLENRGPATNKSPSVVSADPHVEEDSCSSGGEGREASMETKNPPHEQDNDEVSPEGGPANHESRSDEPRDRRASPS